MICGPGENAGVIDIGDGQACIFKMESHNHPSYIEPYQGAATGVGGIMRDVFTMGARPIALLNALRFGDPGHPKTKRLVTGVVAGIGGYGNCVGVPTVAGETNFHRGYDGNILVNAMCVGLADADKIFYSAAPAAGLPVVYFGSKTGRDGIHGATMASAEFDDDVGREAPHRPGRRPLRREAADRGHAGADGLGRRRRHPGHGRGGPDLLVGRDGRQGRRRHRARPRQGAPARRGHDRLRDDAVGKPGADAGDPEAGPRGTTATRIFEKWGLDAAIIGKTTDTGHLVLKHHGEVVCDVPLAPLFDDAPALRPAVGRSPSRSRASSPADVPAPGDCDRRGAEADGLPRHGVQALDLGAVRPPRHGRHPGGLRHRRRRRRSCASTARDKALAVTSDCTPRYVQADPYEGGKQAVAEAWRNLTAVGADPIAITDNLNFGNPERPEIMGQIVRAIDGMAEACRALDFPVVSGNVSLYNETNGAAIPPTPDGRRASACSTDYDARADFCGLKPRATSWC